MIRRRLAALAALATATTACKGPPDAPQDLEALTGYLFDHMSDDDDVALKVGLDNLYAWTAKPANLEESQDGYTIYNLDKEALDRLDDRTRRPDDLIGAAVTTTHGHGLVDMTDALIVKNQAEVFDGNYLSYEREWTPRPRCFPEKECTLLDGEATSSSKWAGLVEVTTENRVRARWVTTDNGDFMFQRNYLFEPVDVDFGNIEMNGQYFMAILYRQGGRTVRVSATWFDVDYGVLPISEDGAKNLVIKEMKKQGEQLDAYLDGE